MTLDGQGSHSLTKEIKKMKTPNIAEIINNSSNPNKTEKVYLTKFKNSKMDITEKKYLHKQLPLPTIASAM